MFHSISTGNAILFLGAGASVTEKRYLSKDIILLYEENINKNLGVTDLVEFVDILSADEKFDRIEFDTFVYKLLEKLKFND
ncbi:MAG: hypothetical protein Q8M94_17695, partial [Ignavibacteria bacterium]|nr:hypothetical protein [Ignavibacteria bacterium]